MDNLEPITRNEMFLNGDDLEPITREEMILAGADLEPITRHEWFLKKYRGGGGGGGYDLVNVPNLPADIASFNDGTDLPMASLKVAVTPYQDLHGYDGPWVGGAGKNKLENTATTQTINNVTFAVNDDGTISLSGTASGSYSQLAIGRITLPAGTYKISDGLSQNDNYELYIAGISAASTKYDKDKEFTITEEVTNKTVFFYITGGQNVNGLTLKPMIRLSTVSDSTFAPYSNICPIIGWDEAVVTVADDAESPTTSHEYTIDLDGTRYGGVLDVLNGTMTVDRAIKKIGEMNWTYWQGNTFYTESVYSTKGYISTDDLTCSCYGDGSTSTTGVFSLGGNDIQKKYIYLTDPSYSHDASGAAEIKSSLANEEIVYYLATPITVQLAKTPAKSLEGVNNIFTNCGQITEVKYFKKA